MSRRAGKAIGVSRVLATLLMVSRPAWDSTCNDARHARVMATFRGSVNFRNTVC
jgi:hypothetical protein